MMSTGLSLDYEHIKTKVSLGPRSFHSMPLYLLLNLMLCSMGMKGLSIELWSDPYGPQAWT